LSRRTLNLGILAHVDAGKTTLTERLLYDAGVIPQLGSVDDGTTQADSLALERQRGITIKSAVVSFPIGDLTVNLIDTPGHPDFIAEVERALSVLDGAVLVISAVEGVQPQTRILMRALQRLRIPALMFVNKIDCRGADCERVLRTIAERLTPAVVAMGSVQGSGTRAADVTAFGGAQPAFTVRLAEMLAEHDDSVLTEYVEAEGVPFSHLQQVLAEQAKRGNVHPVFYGSALTGAGVGSLTSAFDKLLPAAGHADGPVSGRVFKIERARAGEKIAYVRIFSGSVRTRDRVRFGRGHEQKVTGINVFAGGPAASQNRLSAGEIGTLRGLTEIQVGDVIGSPPGYAEQPQFAPPTLEAVVTPVRKCDNGALRVALSRLAEQDPLISIRQDDARRELSVSLYGEVQKQIIGATLTSEFGLDVSFSQATTICVERPADAGAAVQRLREEPNPYLATVGLRVEPAAPGSGVDFRVDPALAGSMPLAFFRAVEDTVSGTLRHGVYGWEVTDAVITMTHSGYLGKHSLGHARFTKGLSSTGEDFRKLTPVVLMSALRQAGTVVCEPIHRFRLDAPTDMLTALIPALTRLGAVPHSQMTPACADALATVDGEIPAAGVHRLHQMLPGMTRGEGVVECTFAHYQPVAGPFPVRQPREA
jgi:ribosomal protection tetracycline resistance protein